ncbi:MAG: DUF3090 domain-containing protein [Actinomycetota bacterium]|nr:DUF3090 domain-containing protein [Actinomycetota bacterium]
MEISPVTRITADAIGEPGQRAFYLQARGEDDLVTIHVEKEQVQLLAASIIEILARVGKETEEGPNESEMELEEPIEPIWRAGRLSIGYEEERDLLLLEIEELVAGEDEETEATDLPDPDRLRLWATREQMLALSRQSAVVAARGRPTCQFCGNPMDPEGHWCPAMNGHRGSAET